jgi:serine/threonine protein phosphatase PrpC
MSSIKLAAPTSRQTQKVLRAPITVLSPGKDDDELKDQDRIMLVETAACDQSVCQFAIVCDGTTTSPYAADAAKFVAENVKELFDPGGLQTVVDSLNGKRADLLAKPVKTQENHSASIRSLWEEIIRKKYQSSYQTTFVAVCRKRNGDLPDGEIAVKALACGDSGIFIFRENGELVNNNLDLQDEVDPFKHVSQLTAVVPDSYEDEIRHVLFEFTPYPENDTHILICSDGFYDAFTNFKEIHDWLKLCETDLEDPVRQEQHLRRLHTGLNQRKGDDDISFIWLRPPQTATGREPSDDEDTKEEQILTPEEPQSAIYRQSMFSKLYLAIVRCFGLRAS